MPMIPAIPPREPDIPSPCVGICMLDIDGLCIGCFRSRTELQDWWVATRAEKEAILARCRARSRQPARLADPGPDPAA